MAKIESRISNSRYLESIGLTLLDEAKSAEQGYIFKKLVPAMAFFCFAFESKLNGYGDAVFSGQELKKYINSTIAGKFKWLCNRIGVEDSDAFQELCETIALMVTFRNSLVHSKIITIEEERDLSELEKLNPRFIRPKASDSDFMEIRSIENAEKFEKVNTMLELIWSSHCIKNQIHIGDDRASLFSRARIISDEL